MPGRVGGLACALGLALYLAGVVVPAARNPNTNGFAAYYTAAHIVVTEPGNVARVYDDAWFQARVDALGFQHVRDIHNVQPPTMALVMAPFAWMPLRWARIAWISASVLFWLAGLAIIAAALRRTGSPMGARPVLLPLAAATTLYLPLTENLRQGQCYTLLFMLLSASCVLAARLDRRDQWWAGVPLGVMAVLKLAGLWLWPLFLLKGRWRTVAAAAATSAGMAALVSVFIGLGPWRAFLHQLPRLATDPVRYVTAYQTVGGLFGHLFVHDPFWNPAPVLDARPLAIALSFAIGIAAFALSAAFIRLDDEDRNVRLLSIAVCNALIVSLAPVAEGYHGLLALPALLVACWWASRPGGPSRLVLGASALLLVVPFGWYGADRLKPGGWALLAYPRLYGSFGLWAWLLVAVRRTAAPLTRPEVLTPFGGTSAVPGRTS
jgi:hypothetical protein